MRIGITYGTFDTLHYGHIRLLQRAKSQCDFLIVGVSTDEFNKIKGKQSILSFEERCSLVSSIKEVDMIIPEENWEQKDNDIKKYDIDIFFMGDDWKGKFDNLDCKVVYFERTPLISSSLIKGGINNV